MPLSSETSNSLPDALFKHRDPTVSRLRTGSGRSQGTADRLHRRLRLRVGPEVAGTHHSNKPHDQNRLVPPGTVHQGHDARIIDRKPSLRPDARIRAWRAEGRDRQARCKGKTHPADRCEFRQTYDQRLAPSFPAEKEALVYYRAYASNMGLDVNSKMKDVPGYPMKANFALAVGRSAPGPTSHNQPAATKPPHPLPHRKRWTRARAISGLFHKKPAAKVPLIQINIEKARSAFPALSATRRSSPAHTRECVSPHRAILGAATAYG